MPEHALRQLAELDVGLLFYLVFGLLAVIVTWINKRKEAAKPLSEADKALLKVLSKPAWKGNIEAVKQHLAAGADVNVKDDSGWTPLHYAARYGRKEVAELLIAKGGDVNAKNIDSETPLDWAIRRKHPETAALLRKHGGKTPEADRALHIAVRTGNVQTAKKHLDAGADVNAKMWRRTPLHRAAREGYKEIVELLIAKGADVNANEDCGWTPLHLAASRSHEEIVELLIAKGADVNAKEKFGWTPLGEAVFKGKKEIAALLRKHGGKTGEELEAKQK